MPAIDRDSRYAIVGDGLLARHLRHYFRASGLALAGWSRREQARAGRSLAESIGDAGVVLLLINDDAVMPFVEAHAELEGRVLVHCAGALVTDRVIGLHPLMTFGPELLPLDAYRAIPFVGDLGRPQFRELFPGLPNPSYAIAADRKPLYHALASLAGNLTPVLWERFIVVLSRDLGLPREVVAPYFEAVVDRCRGAVPFAATGPIARGDRETIGLHLEALRGEPLRPLYECFVRALRPDLLGPR